MREITIINGVIFHNSVLKRKQNKTVKVNIKEKKEVKTKTEKKKYKKPE